MPRRSYVQKFSHPMKFCRRVERNSWEYQTYNLRKWVIPCHSADQDDSIILAPQDVWEELATWILLLFRLSWQPPSHVWWEKWMENPSTGWPETSAHSERQSWAERIQHPMRDLSVLWKLMLIFKWVPKGCLENNAALPAIRSRLL